MRTHEELLQVIQAHVARGAITPSAARGQGAPGAVEAARDFLSALPLEQFGVPDDVSFRRRLDGATQALFDRLPDGAASWGLARKLLNVFLRGCLYNGYLRSANVLEVAEEFYELPLDSITARALRSRRKTLPRWLGVRSLTPAVSDEYQEQAASVAREEGVARVHWTPSGGAPGRLSVLPNRGTNLTNAAWHDVRRSQSMPTVIRADSDGRASSRLDR